MTAFVRAPNVARSNGAFDRPANDDCVQRPSAAQVIRLTRNTEPDAPPPISSPGPGRRPAVRIYRPSRSATQSGTARARKWRLEFEPRGTASIDPLTGWHGSSDPMGHFRLEFPDRDSAVRFATRQGYAFRVAEPHDRRPRVRGVADGLDGDGASALLHP